MVFGGAGPIVGGRLNVILAAARAEQFDRVALVNAEFGGGSCRSTMNWSMHTRPHYAVDLRAFGGHDAHRPPGFSRAGTFHIETGSGAVDAIGVAPAGNKRSRCCPGSGRCGP